VIVRIGDKYKYPAMSGSSSAAAGGHQQPEEKKEG
jgi:hypothetical protein